jgi:hypothetical protein
LCLPLLSLPVECWFVSLPPESTFAAERGSGWFSQRGTAGGGAIVSGGENRFL